MPNVLPSMQAWDKTYFSRVNFTVSSLWVATMTFAFLLCSISSSTYSKHLNKQQGRWLGFRYFIANPQRALIIIQDLLVIHPVSGFIVWVYWVLIANFLGSGSLLVHVGSPNQFGTKVPAFPSWQLNIQSYIVIGFLNTSKCLENTKSQTHTVKVFLCTWFISNSVTLITICTNSLDKKDHFGLTVELNSKDL